MRSPSTFDLRAALTREVRAAMDEFDDCQGDARAMHRCRVRLKRARALARVGAACAPGLSAVFIESTRPVMRALAQPRELLALSDTARALAREAKSKARAALRSAAEQLDAERLALPAVNRETGAARLKDLLALALVWPEASPRQLRRGAMRLERRARRARRRWCGVEGAALRHEWRKREKDRYYAALLLDEAWPARRRRKLGAKLGDVLGQERDTELLRRRLSAQPELAGSPELANKALKALERRRAALAHAGDALGARLRRRAA